MYALGGKVLVNIYTTTNSNIENICKKLAFLLFGTIPLATLPGMICSYYKYYTDGNDPSHLKLTFLSA